MTRQCPNCGTACVTDDAFCCNCGSSLNLPVRQPQPSYQPRRHSAPVNSGSQIRSIAKTIMRYISFILIGLTIFTLLLSILNFTGGYTVTSKITGSGYGESADETGTAKMSEILKTEGTDAFEPLGFCTKAYAVFNLALTVLSGLMVFQIFQGNRKIRRSVNRYALIGLIGSVFFFLFFWLTGIYEMSMFGAKIKIVIYPHFTVWLSAILFTMLYALNFLTKKKRRRR